MIREILLLGDPKLYETSASVAKTEIGFIENTVIDLHDTLIEYRRKYGAGRAIAAPQIGVQQRLLYMFIDKPVVFINPTITYYDNELMEVMDDCMSFPGLLVKVNRHRRCKIEYLDMDWKTNEMELDGDLSELLQHEYDHLNGVLATMRAVDNKSLFIKIC
ncbi:MAG: peptide deformylase [Clostridiaceae bacterium]|nr:peptide deformylase [Clostridiaceae bacterium]